MNILPDPISQDNEMAIMAETRKETLLGSIRRVPGLRLFELDLETQEVKMVEWTDSVGDFFGKGAKYSVQVKKGNKYCQCLNQKNAERKFRKWGILKKKSN
jgi:hypothetical protein